MLLIAVPVTVVFLAGLDLLWLYSLGGRRVPGRPEPADQQRRPSSRVPRVGQLRKTYCTRPTGPE